MKRCASLLAIARRAVEGRLYGLKVEKAHIRGKNVPFVFAHQAHLRVFAARDCGKSRLGKGFGDIRWKQPQFKQCIQDGSRYTATLPWWKQPQFKALCQTDGREKAPDFS